jgi:signal recognition particle receptor subunit beta
MAEALDWSSVRGIATNLLTGNPTTILLAVVVAFSVPILLHYLLYRGVTSPTLASFILLGPNGTGKTALFSLVGYPSVSW